MSQINLHTCTQNAPMLYGERLRLAIEKRSQELQREIAPKELAVIADCKVQNIYMILNNTKGGDQMLGALAHSRVARFLRVNADWLVEEIGEMEPGAGAATSPWSQAARDIADLYDTIPIPEKVKRIQAFNAATTAILQVLRPDQASGS